MKRLLIVWHSRTGGSEQMARAAADAARRFGAEDEGELDVRLQRAEDTTGDDVLAADGYLFAAPENLATMAGQMKEFFDRIYYVALDRINGRPYAILVCAGSDGSGAVRQIQRIATGLRLKEVVPALIVNTAAQTPEAILAPKTIPDRELAHCREIGAALAAGLAAGVF
ncbi:MAG: flavodoxin family protein [Gemmatimonadota bacterium]